jgi:hypothetical protein
MKVSEVITPYVMLVESYGPFKQYICQVLLWDQLAHKLMTFHLTLAFKLCESFRGQLMGFQLIWQGPNVAVDFQVAKFCQSFR